MRRLGPCILLALSTLLLVSLISAQQTATTSKQTATSVQQTSTKAVPNLIRYSGTLKDAQGASLAPTTLNANVAGTAPGGITTYSGFDDGAGGPPHPLSDAAAAAFDAATGHLPIINFESAPLGDYSSLVVAPGVTLTGTDYDFDSQSIFNAPVCAPSLCGYNTTLGGSQWANLFGGSITFTFSTPISAFGAYFTGVKLGTNNISFFDGSNHIVPLPFDRAKGGTAFVGFTDTTADITSVNVNSPGDATYYSGDVFGVDDVRYGTIPGGGISCMGVSSHSVLVNGTNVTAYVPRGNWNQQPNPNIVVVPVEPTPAPPMVIPTPGEVVNSCASDATTLQTVCTANDNTVYIISGAAITNTKMSDGIGQIAFSGGYCTNCGVAMDATQGRALIALSLKNPKGGFIGGFQYLDLQTATFETAFASQSPPYNPGSATISEGILYDPFRNLILSPNEGGTYELVQTVPGNKPAFFERNIQGGNLDSAAEDCNTGIVLASIERTFSLPDFVYIADLTQAKLTFGNPGTWTAPSQFQRLAETDLSACRGTGGIMVAQGTHTGVVAGEFECDGIIALALPTTSGTGTPAIQDWVQCGIGNGFLLGDDPHTVTAYRTPDGTGDAIGLFASTGAYLLARVDLTMMLNQKIVPRDAGGHFCASKTLSPPVVSIIGPF
jgi:hypothetical protein